MIRKIYFTILAAAAFSSFQGNAQGLIGITSDDRIFTMASVSAPGTISTPISITGITSGQTIVGADYRPLTGELYALGYNKITTDAQLYTINASTGVATAINTTPIQLVLGNGTGIGFDFNPTVDRIRVVGANRKNYRLVPTTGAIAATDGDLVYAPGDPNMLATPSIGAVAYTNSYVGASTTVLYDYDDALNIIAIQNPPNNGTLNTVGPTGIVLNSSARSLDMDIFIDPISLANTAYISANTGASINDNLYSLNLTTGISTSLGVIGGGLDIKNIAIMINRTLPAPGGNMIYGLQKGSNTIISFSTDNPKFLRSYMAVTGITAGQNLVGIDFRPATFELYALGYNETNGQYQLYTINTSTAVATAINSTPVNLNLGTAAQIGFDFNPVADRIRVVSSRNGMSYRLNPTDGSISATDTALVYASADINNGKTPKVGSVGYTNSYKGTTSTTLFGVDDTLGSIVKISPPNSGTLSTVGSAIFVANILDLSSDIDFFYDSTTAKNIGYLVVNSGTATFDKFYTFSADTTYTSGSLTVVNDIGLGIAVTDIAAQPQFRNSNVGISNVATTQNRFIIYPNPTADDITVIVKGINYNNHNTRLVITDITGKVMKDFVLTNSKVTMSDLQPGMYFVALSVDGVAYESQKVIRKQ